MYTEKEFYKKQLSKTLIHAAISFAIFTSIFAGMMSESEQSVLPAILAGICYAGVPCGWSITGKIFGGWYITGVVGICIVVLRLMLAVIIGLFALPIQIVRLNSKIRSASEDVLIEEV